MIEEGAWVILDDPDEDIIVGNRAGLKSLQSSIDKALLEGDADVLYSEDEVVVRKVLFRERKEYLEKTNSETSTKKFHNKLISFGFIVWFLVLPFVAIGLLCFLIFTGNTNKGHENHSQFSPVKPVYNAVANKFKNSDSLRALKRVEDELLL